ncbi:MAG: hypothetical protein WC805_01900 [Patescibacteria group bacterium]|jgi:hypothetical protein
MKTKSRTKNKHAQLQFKALRNLSFILAGVILVGALIYYVKSGVTGSSAFEQFPRSLVYAVVSQSGVPQVSAADGTSYAVHYAKPGDTVDMYVVVKNLSKNTKALVWYPQHELAAETNMPNAHAIGAGTFGDVQPTWLDNSSFIMNGNRLAYYDGPAVHKGKYMVLAWRIKIANSAVLGNYPLDVALVREYDEQGNRVYNNGKTYPISYIHWVFNVSNIDMYSSNFHERSGYTPTAVAVKYETAPDKMSISTYNLTSGQVREIYQATINNLNWGMHPVIADPYVGKLLLTTDPSRGTSDQVIDLNGNSVNVPGLDLNQWWFRALAAPDSQTWMLEKNFFDGVHIYDLAKQAASVFAFDRNLNERFWLADSSRVFWSAYRGNKLAFYQLFMNSDRQPEPVWWLNHQGFNEAKFSLEGNVGIGTIVNYNSAWKWVPPSEIKSIRIDTGLVQSLIKSSVAKYRVEAISPDGSMFIFTADYPSGSLVNSMEGGGQVGVDNTVTFISRTGDVFQPMVLSKDMTGISVRGWSKDNRYVVYEEYPYCGEGAGEVCPDSKLWLFDLSARQKITPAITNIIGII